MPRSSATAAPRHRADSPARGSGSGPRPSILAPDGRGSPSRQAPRPDRRHLALATRARIRPGPQGGARSDRRSDLLGADGGMDVAGGAVDAMEPRGWAHRFRGHQAADRPAIRPGPVVQPDLRRLVVPDRGRGLPARRVYSRHGRLGCPRPSRCLPLPGQLGRRAVGARRRRGHLPAPRGPQRQSARPGPAPARRLSCSTAACPPALGRPAPPRAGPAADPPRAGPRRGADWWSIPHSPRPSSAGRAGCRPGSPGWSSRPTTSSRSWRPPRSGRSRSPRRNGSCSSRRSVGSNHRVPLGQLVEACGGGPGPAAVPPAACAGPHRLATHGNDPRFSLSPSGERIGPAKVEALPGGEGAILTLDGRTTGFHWELAVD